MKGLNAFPVVILAGGLATRLRPLTTSLPKALIEINGEPFIKIQLRLLKSQGITDVVLCLGFLGEMVQSYIEDGNDLGLNVQYSYDGDIALGTGGAIKKALPLLTDSFFVIYGDSYLPCDYIDVQNSFIKAKKQGLMTVFHNGGQWDRSNVEFRNDEILVYDKVNVTTDMKHIDYGLGVLSQHACSSIPDEVQYDLADLYQSLLSSEQLASYEVKQRFYEVGSHSGIEEFSEYIKGEQ